jgi:para-aminobenzoate synthetase component 1
MKKPPPAQPAIPPETDPSHWVAHRWFTASGTLVAELRAGLEPFTLFQRLSRRRHCLFLDSAALDAPHDGRDTIAAVAAEPHTVRAGPAANASPTTPRLARFSFVAADPIHSIQVEPAGAGRDTERVNEAFVLLRSLLVDLACETVPGLPPFQGGVAGLVSYDCGLTRLGVPPPAGDAGVPLLSLHVYDVVCAFDHDAGRGWIISQGVPARGPTARRARAEERLNCLLAALTETAAASNESPVAPPSAEPRLPRELPGHELPGYGKIVSTQSRATYLDMVRAGIDLVRAGDIFQVNLAQRLSLAATLDPVELHRRSRLLNPAPFAACFDAGPATIVSMSPERLLRVERGTVRMHPIKGTRRVLASPEADLYAGEDLEHSEKDRAENVMIVDLVRNDLSRVCTPESVRVEALCRLERYRYVQHLVSIVAGRLRPGLTPLDALDAAIPGGSVTGAPKHRACEIIGQLEGFVRGAYCGSLGYVGFDGTADFNLLIRTFVVGPDSITCAVGGGITASSDPAAEYAETLHKAEGMLRVLASFDGDRDGDRDGDIDRTIDGEKARSGSPQLPGDMPTGATR